MVWMLPYVLWNGGMQLAFTRWWRRRGNGGREKTTVRALEGPFFRGSGGKMMHVDDEDEGRGMNKGDRWVGSRSGALNKGEKSNRRVGGEGEGSKHVEWANERPQIQSCKRRACAFPSVEIRHGKTARWVQCPADTAACIQLWQIRSCAPASHTVIHNTASHAPTTAPASHTEMHNTALHVRSTAPAS